MSLAVFAMSFASEVFRPANSVAMAQRGEPETRDTLHLALPDGSEPRLDTRASLGRYACCFWLGSGFFWIDELTCVCCITDASVAVATKAAVIFDTKQ